MSNDHCRFLMNMYRTKGISAEESVNMVQHLLDTDMLADYPEFVLLCADNLRGKLKSIFVLWTIPKSSTVSRLVL